MATKSTPFNDWLLRNDIDRSVAAKELEVSNAAVGRYCIGERIPEPSVMVKIIRWTKGEIDANSFYGYVNGRFRKVA